MEVIFVVETTTHLNGVRMESQHTVKGDLIGYDNQSLFIRLKDGGRAEYKWENVKTVDLVDLMPNDAIKLLNSRRGLI